MIGKFCVAVCAICLSSAYSWERKKNRGAAYVFISILILILTLAFTFREYIFQDGMGADYFAYQQWFQSMSFSRLGLRFTNIGFDVFIVAVKLFYNNFHFFLFLCGLLINTLIYRFIEKHSYDVFFSSVLYVCLMYFSAFNILRQWIACAIYLSAFEFLMDKTPVKYTLLVILAATFHNSAIFLLFLYPIINCRISFPKKASLTMAASVLCYVGFPTVFRMIMALTEKLGLGYLQKYGTALNLDLGNFTPFIISLFISICLIYMYFNNMLDEQMQKYAVWGILATGCTFLSPVNFIFNRMSVYVFVSCIITFPIILKSLSDNGSKHIFKMAVGGLVLISFVI